MQLHSPLSATAKPFPPGATPSSALVDDAPRDYPAQDGLVRSSPAQGSTRGPPVREATPNHQYTSDEEGVSTYTTTSEIATPMSLSTLEGDKRKMMDFLVRSKSLNLEVRRVILMMWLTPLDSGPIVSLITVTIMRIPTSCP